MLDKWCPVYRWHESNPGFSMELREPVVLMLKENIKQGSCKMESTETVHWDGSLCSSDEVTVIVMERRE
jgi:hypothetical protein